MSPRGWQQGGSAPAWHTQQSKTPRGAWVAGVQRGAGFGGNVGRRSAGHKPGWHRRAVPTQMSPNPALHCLMPARHPSPPPQPGGAGTFLLPGLTLPLFPSQVLQVCSQEVASPGASSQVLHPRLLLRLLRKLVSAQGACSDAGGQHWAWASSGLWGPPLCPAFPEDGGAASRRCCSLCQPHLAPVLVLRKGLWSSWSHQEHEAPCPGTGSLVQTWGTHLQCSLGCPLGPSLPLAPLQSPAAQRWHLTLFLSFFPMSPGAGLGGVGGVGVPGGLGVSAGRKRPVPALLARGSAEWVLRALCHRQVL